MAKKGSKGKKDKKTAVPRKVRKGKVRARKLYTVKGKLRFKRKVTYYTGNTHQTDGKKFSGKWEYLSGVQYDPADCPSIENVKQIPLAKGYDGNTQSMSNGVFEFKIAKVADPSNIFLLVTFVRGNESVVRSFKDAKDRHVFMRKGQELSIGVDLNISFGKDRVIDLGDIDLADPESEKLCMMYFSIRHVHQWCRTNVSNFSNIGKTLWVWPVNRLSAVNKDGDGGKGLILINTRDLENMEVVAHEFAHLLHWRLKFRSLGTFGHSYHWDWPYEDKDPSGHSLFSEEFEEAAYFEGLAHFFSLMVRNSEKMYDGRELRFDVLRYKSGAKEKVFEGRQVEATVTSVLLAFVKEAGVTVSDVLKAAFNAGTLYEFYDTWKGKDKTKAAKLKELMLRRKVHYRLHLDKGWKAVAARKNTPSVNKHAKEFSDLKALYKQVYEPFGSLADDWNMLKLVCGSGYKRFKDPYDRELGDFIFPREFHNYNKRHNSANYNRASDLYTLTTMPDLNKKYIVPIRKPL